ncbi:MAG: hypothetical protein VXW32_16510, partial [Myxococcota bacterium]|nr:hypothetical protein [Myxococcota bacterium]
MTASLFALLVLGMAACSDAPTPDPVHTGDTGPVSSFLTLCEGAFEPPDLRLDCNADGVPDAETLASNPSLDQDTDGVLDTCQSPRQPILY